MTFRAADKKGKAHRTLEFGVYTVYTAQKTNGLTTDQRSEIGTYK